MCQAQGRNKQMPADGQRGITSPLTHCDYCLVVPKYLCAGAAIVSNLQTLYLYPAGPMSLEFSTCHTFVDISQRLYVILKI